jgi:hypothetical protein
MSIIQNTFILPISPNFNVFRKFTFSQNCILNSDGAINVFIIMVKRIKKDNKKMKSHLSVNYAERRIGRKCGSSSRTKGNFGKKM